MVIVVRVPVPSPLARKRGASALVGRSRDDQHNESRAKMPPRRKNVTLTTEGCPVDSYTLYATLATTKLTACSNPYFIVHTLIVGQVQSTAW